MDGLVVSVEAEVDARLRIGAERGRAGRVRVVVDRVVVAAVGAERGVALGDQGRPLHCGVDRIDDAAVGAAAAAHVEPAVPARRQAQSKVNRVLLAVDAGARVDGAVDLAMLGRGRHGRHQRGGGDRRPCRWQRGYHLSGCRRKLRAGHGQPSGSGRGRRRFERAAAGEREQQQKGRRRCAADHDKSPRP